jgi:hypothetical protein
MKHALLIGINYSSIADMSLHGCIDDIENMQDMLIREYAYDASNIVILRDDVSDSTHLPTRENIILQLNNLANKTLDLEEIWIHYSGHGSQIRDCSVIIPLDYQSSGVIMDYELLDIIEKIRCRAFLIFDSCHSGTVCDLPWSFEYKSHNKFLITHNNANEFTNPNIYMYSGCKDNQTSADTYSKQLHESVGAFTDAFLICLNRRQYTTTVTQLYEDICLYLMKNGYQQTPMFSSSSKNPEYTIMPCSR